MGIHQLPQQLKAGSNRVKPSQQGQLHENMTEQGLSHHVTVVTVLQGHESLASAKTTEHPGH